MIKNPSDLRYTKTHEWVRRENDNEITVGITDHAQELLGDIVYVDLPSPAKHVDQGAEVSVVESVKTAADVYAPLSGTVIATNQEVGHNPSLINKDPYQQGWLFRM